MWADIFPPSESTENWSRQSEREQNKLQSKQVNQSRTNTNRDQLKTKGAIHTQIATLNAGMKGRGGGGGGGGEEVCCLDVACVGKWYFPKICD